MGTLYMLLVHLIHSLVNVPSLHAFMRHSLQCKGNSSSSANTMMYRRCKVLNTCLGKLYRVIWPKISASSDCDFVMLIGTRSEELAQNLKQFYHCYFTVPSSVFFPLIFLIYLYSIISINSCDNWYWLIWLINKDNTCINDFIFQWLKIAES